jgi:hypothetical protein
LKLKNGEGAVTTADLVVIVLNILRMATAMAVFLVVCARVVFRNRKRLKDESSDNQDTGNAN